MNKINKIKILMLDKRRSSLLGFFLLSLTGCHKTTNGTRSNGYSHYKSNPRLAQDGTRSNGYSHYKSNPRLAQVGCNLPKRHLNRKTELHFAAEEGNEEATLTVIRKLQLKGNVKDINIRDENGQTALHLAAIGDHESVVDILLQHRAEIDETDNENKTPLYRAIEYGREASVKLLLYNRYNNKANPKSEVNQNALNVAIEQGHLEIVRALISAGAELNARVYNGNDTPLHCAALYNRPEIVSTLLRNGALINAEDHSLQTALHVAVRHGHKSVVSKLLRWRDLQEGGKTGTAQEADVNIQDDHGKTPLHYAYAHKRKIITQLLLKAIPNEKKRNYALSIKDELGKTPLDENLN